MTISLPTSRSEQALSAISLASDSDEHLLDSPLLHRPQNDSKSPWAAFSGKTVYSLVAVAFVFSQILFAIHSQISVRTLAASGNRWHASPDEEVSAAMDALVATHTDGLLNDVRTLWSDSEVFPQTKLIRHAPGFTVLDNLYSLNGTIYIVSDRPTLFPETKMMTSSGVKVDDSQDRMKKLEPSNKDIRIIGVKEAKVLFGKQAGSVSGVSFMNSDDPQYITHYYHFSAELLFGLWRTYTSPDADIHSNGATILPSPSRLIFTHTGYEHWRDYASMNQWIFHAAFPSASLEFKGDWEDRARMEMGWVYDRVVLADRGAAMRAASWEETWRYASSAFELVPGPDGDKGEVVVRPSAGWWWSPIRKNVLRFAEARKQGGVFVRKAVDLVYASSFSTKRDGARANEKKPVVTYVSRQGWGRRMLKQEDHEVLVSELKKLEREEGYELNIVHMEGMTREEQLRLAGKTDILMGVHGNGLTALLWMDPKPYSTVMEFFCPGGFARDYEWTANRLGITHYGFWGNSSFTAPNTPPRGYPACFQSNDIPLDGKLVAKLVKERLALRN